MKKLVILDCDGTLVDSQNGIWEAMVHAFSGLGLPVPSRAAAKGEASVGEIFRHFDIEELEQQQGAK